MSDSAGGVWRGRGTSSSRGNETERPVPPKLTGLIEEPFISGTGRAIEESRPEIRYKHLSFTIRVTPRIARILKEGQEARRRVLREALFPTPRR